MNFKEFNKPYNCMENFNVVLMSTFHFHINLSIWYKERQIVHD
jgi:hypothetical protein